MKKINWISIVLFTVFSTVLIIACKQKPSGKPDEKGSLLKLVVGDIVKEGTNIKSKMIFPAVEFSTEKIPVEYVVKPVGTSVTFDPALDKDGNWVLAEGKNILKITIGAGSSAAVYHVELMRQKVNARLTSLKIGENTADIAHEMDFGRLYSKKVLVEFSVDPPNSKVTFDPPLDSDNFLSLKDGENIINITVANGESKNKYKAKVLQGKIRVKRLADYILIRGGAQNGKRSTITTEQSNRLINGEENVTVELLGTEASIVFASKSEKWMSVKINGKPYIPMSNYGNFASADVETIALPPQGETLDVKLEIETLEKIAEINFKIKRLTGTVDIPDLSLLVMDKDVSSEYTSNGKTVIERLFEGGSDKADIKVSKDPAPIAVRCTKDVMAKVLINNKDVQIREQKRKDDFKTIRWLCKDEISGASTSPDYKKEVKIEIIPKNTTDYHTVNWVFDILTVPDSNNAQFKIINTQYGAKYDIKVSNIKWYDNGDIRLHPDLSDYGAIYADFTAVTAMPNANVYYSIVSGNKKESTYTWILENEIELKAPVKMENDRGKHKAKIDFYTDKPTFIKLHVVAPDGSTKDNIRGVYYCECNGIELKWDYTKKQNGNDFQNSAYGEIKVKKNENFYVAFLVSSDEKYSIKPSIAGQDVKIEKLNRQKGYKQWHCAEINASHFKDSNTVDFIIQIVEAKSESPSDSQKCFEYKIKLKAE